MLDLAGKDNLGFPHARYRIHLNWRLIIEVDLEQPVQDLS